MQEDRLVQACQPLLPHHGTKWGLAGDGFEVPVPNLDPVARIIWVCRSPASVAGAGVGVGHRASPVASRQDVIICMVTMELVSRVPVRFLSLEHHHWLFERSRLYGPGLEWIPRNVQPWERACSGVLRFPVERAFCSTGVV